MKANEFIKKHGWQAVIEAVKTTPVDHDFQSTDLEPKLAKDGSIIRFDCKIYTISHAEVKRLVESHELVESYGGLENAKGKLEYFDWIPSGSWNHALLSKAIADVESCL